MRTLLPVGQELSPYSWYRAMRESTPVSFDTSAGYWQAFRYNDVQRIATDYATFSSEERRRRVVYDDGTPITPSIISMDPPRHKQFRGLVSQAFTPRTVAQLAPRITAIAHELIDRVAPTGAMDVIDDLAYPLPVIVIAGLLGIPEEDRSRFRQWSDTLLAEDDESGEAGNGVARLRSDDKPRPAITRTLNEMRDYFKPVLAVRRRHPQADLISSLLAAEVDGQRLTEDELLGFCTLLLVAGNITTTNLLGNAMVCFDEHPDALAVLRHEPTLVPRAIEEVLRYRPPAKMLVRIVTTDTTVAHQPVEKGEVIVGWIASANHDDAHFSDPERFDIRREPNPHLTFGHGIHFCIGAPLARLEGKLALQVMLERLPEMVRVPGKPLEPIHSAILSGVKHFPITFGDA